MANLEQFRDQLEDWAEALLRPYLARLAARTGGEAGKEFNDPIWGTIVLRPVEVIILDSPLLQRLRFIRQLGVVHLVYAAANHTRLEHTIGVVHQVDRLVDSLNEHYGAGTAIDDRKRALLRVTALTHDVGHGLMSHVSENALDNFEEVQELRLDFADVIGAEDVPVAEIASYYVLGSPAFAELVSRAKELADDHSLPPNAIDQMRRIVIGEKVDNKVPLLHELISGPFDADKLDYMTRDAFMTGVPVVTDIPRLVQKVRAVELPESKLPPQVAATVKKGLASYVMTGISLSGGRTLDELMFGQVLLYDKLYRHQKVRAAEAMLASIFRQVGPLLPEGPAMLGYKFVDHAMFELDEAAVVQLAGRDLTDDELKQVGVAVELSQRLGARDLFVRAFAFALDMPLDPYHSDIEHYDGLEQVIANSDEFEFRGELVGSISDEVTRICELVAPEVLERYPVGVKPYIWLDPPLSPPGSTQGMHAWLVAERDDAREVLPFREGVAGASRWSEAYLLTRDTGFIFTTSELAVYTYIASEAVFRRDHAVRIPASMQTYAKQDPEVVATCKRRLEEAGYYATLPHDIRPLPERLQKADIGQRVAAVLENLRGYEGPVGARAEKGMPLLSEQRIYDWLRQFDNKFDDEPLNLLEEVRLVGRREVIAAVEQFMESHADDFNRAAVCPLGTAKDSSVITTYYANDLRGFHDLEVMSLSDALAGPDRPIVFLDDFVGSGQQSVSILEAWMGEEPSTDLGEERRPLGEAAREGLRERTLGFVFAAGMTDGVDLLRDALKRLRLTGEVYLSPSPVAPRAFESGSAERQRLRDECERIGLELLDDGDAKHDKAWRERRALGYGNNAFLVAFPYNTPTQTLTCLWRAGKVDGVEWLPLLPRRRKV